MQIFFEKNQQQAYMPTQFSLKRLIICTFQKIKPTQSLHKAYTMPTQKNIQPTQNLHRFLAKTA